MSVITWYTCIYIYIYPHTIKSRSYKVRYISIEFILFDGHLYTNYAHLYTIDWCLSKTLGNFAKSPIYLVSRNIQTTHDRHLSMMSNCLALRTTDVQLLKYPYFQFPAVRLPWTMLFSFCHSYEFVLPHCTRRKCNISSGSEGTIMFYNQHSIHFFTSSIRKTAWCYWLLRVLLPCCWSRPWPQTQLLEGRPTGSRPQIRMLVDILRAEACRFKYRFDSDCEKEPDMWVGGRAVE